MTTAVLRDRLKSAWRPFDKLPLRWCGRSKQWELVKAERALIDHTEALELLVERSRGLIVAWISDENGNVGLEDHDGEFCRCDICEAGREWIKDFNRLTEGR